MDVKAFYSHHKRLVIGTLGFAVVGYIGYKTACWILKKLGIIKKTDDVAQNILGKKKSGRPSSSTIQSKSKLKPMSKPSIPDTPVSTLTEEQRKKITEQEEYIKQVNELIKKVKPPAQNSDESFTISDPTKLKEESDTLLKAKVDFCNAAAESEKNIEEYNRYMSEYMAKQKLGSESEPPLSEDSKQEE